MTTTTETTAIKMTLNAEEIIKTLELHKVEADYTFVADRGADWGYIDAWLVDGGQIVVKTGTNGWTEYELADRDIDEIDPLEWLSGDDHSLEARANLLGIGAIPEAKATETGPFHILSSVDYYGPTSHCSVVAEEGTENPREFETIEVAQAWIDENSGGPVYLSHNQATGPEYKIVSG